MKKILSIVLAFALIVTLVPGYGQPSKVEAAGSHFNFPNEKDDIGSPRIVSEKFVTLNGTLYNIARNSISYKVEQVTLTSDKPLNQTESISTGIETTGDNKITINSLELFPGINRITFTGISGASTIVESIYIEYRDNPMLNDLKLIFRGSNGSASQEYLVAESGPTVIYGSTTNNAPTIVVTGQARNASRINVQFNDLNQDYNVRQDNIFTTAAMPLEAGINNITFKVMNNGQVIETTRQIVYYNGNATHYNQFLNYGTTPTSLPLSNRSEYSVIMSEINNNATITGETVIPLPLYEVPIANPPVPISVSSNLNNAISSRLEMDFNGTTLNNPDVDYTLSSGATDTSGYIMVKYTFTLPANLEADKAYSYTIKAPNLTGTNTSSPITFTLRDGGKSYIAAINYLSGFDSDMTDKSDSNLTESTAKNSSRILSLQGSSIPASGVDVYSLPMGVEVLVGNHTGIGTSFDSEILDIINNSMGTSTSPVSAPFRLINSGGAPLTQTVQRTINGVEGTYLRIFLEFDKLGKSGSNELSFNLNSTAAISEKKVATFRVVFGPFVKFTSIVDGMAIVYDSEDQNANKVLIEEKLKLFEGQIMNIATPGDIKYSGSSPQTAFLYLNNVEIPLKAVGVQGFEFDETKGGLTYIANVMNTAGENTLKFVYRSARESYESTIKFSIVPKNLPEVPAKDSDGVYPYRTGQWPPLPNDPNFTNNGSVYLTKEAQFNVHGTFDFIDLGKDEQAVIDKLNPAGGQTAFPAEKYIVTISNPNWGNSYIEWNLGNEFLLTDKDRNVLTQANGTPIKINEGNFNQNNQAADVTFYYDLNSQQFFFEINNQEMPEDGSPLAYVITVFNAGPAGPRATYRLEVNPLSIPFSIKSPVLEDRVINKNYVEVIISAPGADSIVIDKINAEKVAFIDSHVPMSTVNAFRAVVKDLKPNKDTKITFTITRGDTKLTDSFNVKYVPTNIPGAQHLETMKNSHKVFNNSLNLTFPKNTSLIRSNYNDAEDYATQVYSGHDLLFAIANPTDGIVDRHIFETQPSLYSALNEQIGNFHLNYRFQDEANRFIKASPLYWIDGGLADDPDTGKYDPIQAGLDPFPFPNLVGKYTGNFETRERQYVRELIPSNAGTLTLSYDSNIVASAGTTVAVFRLDPVTMKWENIGGVVDTKKGTISVPFTKFGYYVVVKLTRSFNDIIDHSYARDAMEAIFAKGIMNAVDSVGVFGGDRYITRGEFTRMIVKALELPLNYHGELHFTYYPETVTNESNPRALYDYRYIETAARAGIVNGTRPGFFDEDVQLSREQAATMLARALELKLETDSTKAKAQLDKAFKDGIARFDNYAIPSVLAIQKKGFIVGKPIDINDPKAGYMYDPKARMLRSDAAIIMARVLTDMKKLPKIYN